MVEFGMECLRWFCYAWSVVLRSGLGEVCSLFKFYSLVLLHLLHLLACIHLLINDVHKSFKLILGV
jgi:hypothetical protein